MSDRESLFASDLDVLYAACPDKDEDGHCEFCSALDRLVAEARPRWCGRQKTWREHFENVNRQLNRKQVECDDLTERTLDAEADAKRLRYALDLAFATAGFSEARKAHILETGLPTVGYLMPQPLTVAEEMTREMQAEWFIREVKRCQAIGMPVGCCDEWPECSHVLAWVESRNEKEPS